MFSIGKMIPFSVFWQVSNIIRMDFLTLHSRALTMGLHFCLHMEQSSFNHCLSNQKFSYMNYTMVLSDLSNSTMVSLAASNVHSLTWVSFPTSNTILPLPIICHEVLSCLEQTEGNWNNDDSKQHERKISTTTRKMLVAGARAEDDGEDDHSDHYSDNCIGNNVYYR